MSGAVRVVVPFGRAVDYEVGFVGLGEAFGDVGAGDGLLTDSNLAGLYPEVLARFGGRAVVVPAGEGSKSLGEYGRAVREFAAGGLLRTGRIFAFGGGVVGDLAGFVASSYHRGVRLVQVPTSLLAMVDSSVGGKVGLDLPEGKNLVGAFLHPDSVRVPLEVLATLPREEFENGLAEVVKYGLIADAAFADFLGTRRWGLDSEGLEGVIRRCIELKRDVVGEDPEERTGRRAILNFGHTVGHALELARGYGLAHGRAVAMGMVAEAEIGRRVFGDVDYTWESVATEVERQGLPSRPDWDVDLDELVVAMGRDKKATADGLGLSLLERRGCCKLCHGIPREVVRASLQAIWKS